MLLGNWTNFEELEMNLSLPEIEAMIKASRALEERRNRFSAALEGIDLADSSGKETVEDVYHRARVKAAATLQGKTPIEIELGGIGIGFD